jgi:hypothetical protein
MPNRTQQIIASLSQQMQERFQKANTDLPNLTALIGEYQSIVQDLISTKNKYVEIVKKYTDRDFRPTPATFPGIVPSAPKYTNEAMKTDSKELIELGGTINELENQKELVRNQIRQLINSITTAFTSAAGDADQIDMFLSNVIQDNSLNGIYGSPNLNSLVV